MDSHVFPTGIIRLHLGRNYIKNLNNTLRNLSNLIWLFVNLNELDDLEGQLPIESPNLKMIHASHNKIERLPQQLKSYPLLDSLFMTNNRLRTLDGALSKSKNLHRATLEHNQIHTVGKALFIIKLEQIISTWFSVFRLLKKTLLNA